MKLRASITSFCLVASLLVAPAMAFAQLTPANTGLTSAAKGSGLTGGCSSAGCLNDVIGRAINLLLGFLGIVLLCLFLYAGFLWMTAGGEKEKVEKARSYILNAVVGLFIVALAYALTDFVLTNLAAVTAASEEAGPAEPPVPAPVP